MNLLEKKAELDEVEGRFSTKIQEFEDGVSELREERNRLRIEYAEALRAELSGISGKTGTRTRAPSGSVMKPNVDDIITSLQGAGEPVTVETIRREANISDGVSSSSLSLAMKALVDSGKVNRVGAGRGSKYEVSH